MPQRRGRASGKDLFGNPIFQRKTQNQAVLERFDVRTLAERAERLRFLRRIFPRVAGFLMPLETTVIFSEAKMTFINGEFISTVLLASAFIEHRLGAYLHGRGFRKEAKAGLAAIIACARDNGLVDDHLLIKAERIHLVAVMEADAKDALSTMYTIAVSPLG